MINHDVGEQPLQDFLEKHPEVLLRTFDHGAYFPTLFPKFRLADEFIPDFAIIGHRTSWIWNVDLIEIEPAVNERTLFNKKRQSAGRLRDAEGQVRDWQAWMEKYGEGFFAPKVLDQLKKRKAWDERPEFYRLPEGTYSQAMTVFYRIIVGRRKDFDGWGDQYRAVKWKESGNRVEIVPWDRLLDKANQLAAIQRHDVTPS